MLTTNGASAPATRFWRERGPWDWGRVLPTYWEAGAQSHRQFLIQSLRDFPRFETVRELGCCAGTNLGLVRVAYPWTQVQGLDVSQEAVLFAQQKFLRDGAVGVLQADFLEDAPLWQDGEADIVFSCYSLAYVAPEDLENLLGHVVRSAAIGCVFVEPMIGETGLIRQAHGGLIEWRHDYAAILDRVLANDPRAAKLESMPLPEPVESCDGYVRVTFVG